MPKFNKDMIRGMGDDKNDGKLKVGAGLLSDVSKSEIKMKIEHIPRSLIDKNKNNHYSIGDIDSLAWSIREMGLLQPIHVSRTPEGRYRILGGERRITAIDRLIADERVEDWTEDSLIPVVVKGAEDIDLPLSNELKESLSILTTNKEARKYTDGDRFQEIQEWKKIIRALREAGVESISGMDGEGRETEIQIQGEKTREILTQTTGLSRGKINGFEKVENQGVEALKEALLSNDVTLATAQHIIERSETPQEQEEVIESLKQKKKEITRQAINEEFDERGQEDKKGSAISAASFRTDLKKITAVLRKGDIYLDEKALLSYYKYIREIEMLLLKGE